MSHRSSIAASVRSVSKALAGAGVEEPRRDAQLIVGQALGLDRASLIAEPTRALSARELGEVEALARRRARREPMAYLLGQREFWGIDFQVSAETLIPRPESETLVEAALDVVTDRKARLRLLDLGTGTGCLLISLLSELPHASGIGVDVSFDACRVARGNAENIGLGGRAVFIVGDWGTALSGSFDLIVANPPYVPEDEAERLAPEITRFEPASAVFGGSDGLAAYRALAPDLSRLLASGGHGFVEIGSGETTQVGAILARQGLTLLSVKSDLGRRARCLVVGAPV